MQMPYRRKAVGEAVPGFAVTAVRGPILLAVAIQLVSRIATESKFELWDRLQGKSHPRGDLDVAGPRTDRR